MEVRFKKLEVRTIIKIIENESMYFLELLMEILDKDIDTMKELHSEANEILSIIVASINTAK